MDYDSIYKKIYDEYLSGYSLGDLAIKFNVSRQALSQGFKVRGYLTRPIKSNHKQVSENNWEREIKRKYGVDRAWYDTQYKNQKGRCALCDEPIVFRGRTTTIDHNHKTGRVRGLLCRCCNLSRVGRVEGFEDFQKTDWYVRVKLYIKKYERI